MKRAFLTLMLTAATIIPGTAATAENFFADTKASAAADAAATVDAKTLTSAQVRQVQRALVKKGYHISVNGRWQADTRNAVHAYQNARGIRANGALTGRTLADLGVDLDADARGHASTSGSADATAEARTSGAEPASGETSFRNRATIDSSTDARVDTYSNTRVDASGDARVGISGGSRTEGSGGGLAGGSLGGSLGGSVGRIGGGGNAGGGAGGGLGLSLGGGQRN